MKPNLKVSVILTSYNHEKYLKTSIDSVLTQTFHDFDLIIWDDGSTDKSWEIISGYNDPRIIPFRNTLNRKGGNIKHAIKKIARGEYIAIHHSDDVWEPDKLEKQVAFLDSHPEIGAVFSHVNLIDENGQVFSDISHPYYGVFDQPNRTRFEWLRHFFYKGNALCHPSILIRKACYEDSIYRNGMSQLPDFDMWIQLCMNYEIHVLQEKLVRFRLRKAEANQSGNKPETRIRIQFEWLQVLSQYKNIKTIKELVKIFPKTKKYTHKDCSDILFALGMIAVENGSNDPTRLFGLNLLFETLNDADRAPTLEKYFGFNKKTFVKLSGKYDVFSIEKIHELNILTSKNAELEQEILFYANSKSWRLTRPFRKLRKFFEGIITNTS